MIATPAALELLGILTDRLIFAANVDGATTGPLLTEEARNLAGDVIELLEAAGITETVLLAVLALDPAPIP
jgi:hypothetical protein